MRHRPSSLPMLAQCAQFESSGSDFAELGTDRHAALRAHYVGDDSLLELLDDEDQAGVRWAADYIRCNTTEAYPTEWETKRSWTRPNFEQAEGTPDVTNGPTMFDFKWRRRDYTAQMADYALWLIEQGFERVIVQVLFGAEKRAEKLIFDAQACEAILTPILESLTQDTPPSPCEYCSWCSKRAVCKAYVASVSQIKRTKVEDIFSHPKVAAWIERGCHTSDIVGDAELAALLLRWSRQFKKIHDGIEHFAMEAATKRGLILPGFELKERQGRKFVSNVMGAYQVIGLEAGDFLQACDVRLNTSNKYPDRKGLDVIVKEKLGEASMAAAKRTITKKLGDLIQRGKTSLTLKAVGGGDEEESE